MNRMTRRRLLSIVLSLIAMIGTSWLAPIAQSAEAPQISATLQSSTECPAAPKWHMAMLEFFENSTGGTLPRGTTVDSYRNFEMKSFLDGLATETGCALWADIDFYDMGSEVFPSNSFPSEIHKSFLSKGYDVVMYRYPDFGERKTFVGMASSERWIVFPVTSQDIIYGAPWISVIWHEWLHQVEFVALSKKLELGLPKDGVHYVFSSNPYYLSIGENSGWWESSMTFYKDLTAGRVPIEGKKYGFTKKDFSWIGTPSNPKHNIPQMYIYSDGKLFAGTAKVYFTSNSTGQLKLTADNEPAEFTLKIENGGTVKSLSFPMNNPSSRNICIQTSATSDDIWDYSENCKEVTFVDITPGLYPETYWNSVPSEVNPTKVIWQDYFKDSLLDVLPRAQIVIKQIGSEAVFLKEYADPNELSWQLPSLPIGKYNLCLQLEGDTNTCDLIEFEIKKKITTNIIGITKWVAIGGNFYAYNETREELNLQNLAPEVCSSKLIFDYVKVTGKKSGNCRFRITSLGNGAFLPFEKVYSIPVVKRSTIKCQKGKAFTYVTGFMPTCPKGYKKV